MEVRSLVNYDGSLHQAGVRYTHFTGKSTKSAVYIHCYFSWFDLNVVVYNDKPGMLQIWYYSVTAEFHKSRVYVGSWAAGVGSCFPADPGGGGNCGTCGSHWKVHDSTKYNNIIGSEAFHIKGSIFGPCKKHNNGVMCR
jgi:hypothetical protein